MENTKLRTTYLELSDEIRKLFPHGHPKFINLQFDKIRLHSTKNQSYAHDGPPLGNFDRVAQLLSLYPGFRMTSKGVALMYLMKHFDKVMWDFCKTGQIGEENLGDISVYIDIIHCMVKDG